MIFAAIDFETANANPDSACAVRVLVERIRPPTRRFEFTHINGLTLNACAKGEVIRGWATLAQGARGRDVPRGAQRAVSLDRAPRAADVGELSDEATRRGAAARVGVG